MSRARTQTALLAAGIGLRLLMSPESALPHGDSHDRLDALSQRIAEGGAGADLYLQRADLLLQHGDPAAALADVVRASEGGYLAPELALLRSRALRALGETGAARAALDVFIAERPDDLRGYVARAELLAGTGEDRSACDDYARVVERSSSPSPDVFAAWARCMDRSGQWRGALAALDEGARRTGAVSLTSMAVDMALAHGAADEALARVDVILAGAGRKETWRLRRAEILAGAGRGPEAALVASQALAEVERLPTAVRETAAMRDLCARAGRLAGEQGTGEVACD